MPGKFLTSTDIGKLAGNTFETRVRCDAVGMSSAEWPECLYTPGLERAKR